MKKLLTLVLVLVLCLSVLGSCALKDKINGLLGKDPVEEPNEKTALDSAVSFLFDLYKDSAKETPANYNLVNVVTIEGVAYAVTWTVDNELITIVPNETDENLVTVVVPAAGSEDVPYVLTATVTDAEGNTKSKTFDRVVPMFKVNTAAEYYAAESGDLVIVDGIITGISSKSYSDGYNTLYLDDLKGEGGYYIYSFADKADLVKDLGLKIGMTVRVSGTKDVYNGTHEVKDAAFEILDSTVKEVTPTDFTSIFANAADLKDAALVGKQGMFVTIKGVTIGDVGSNGYRHFTLGDKTSYLRISSSSNCMPKDDVAILEKAFVDNKGNIADVTGVISIYSGNFYLSPVSVNAYSNFVTPDRTDAEKVAFELDGVTVTDKVAVDTELTLPAAGTQYTDVVFTWTAEGIEIVDGKINVVLGDEEYTFTLKVVATLGEESAEKTFTVAVDAIKKGSVNLTVDTLGLGEYNAEEESKKVFGFGFSYIQLGNYGNGIQMRDSEKDGVMRTSMLWNTNALGKGIKSITLTIHPTKSAYDNPDAIIFTFGNAADSLNYTTKLTTVKDQMVYTITPDVGTYTFFKLEYDYDKSAYWESIVIDFESDGEIVITDEEKVETEKNAVNVEKTEFAADGTLTLNTTPVMYDDVVITWEAVGAEIVDNKINIVLGREEQTITLTATIQSGEVTDTKEFTVTVAKMPVIQIEDVTTLEAGVPYKFYFNQVLNGEKLYFAGDTADKAWYLATTNAVGKATDVYLEIAYAEDGTTALGYRIYFLKGEEKTYIRMYERTKGAAGKGSGSLELTTTVPTEYYTYNETYKSLVLTTVATDSTEEAPTYNVYYLGTYKNFTTIGCSNASYITSDNLEASNGQYPTHFASFYCLHDYSGDCDLVCNECGAERTSETAHTYAAVCDADCDVCGYVRTDAAAHVAGEDDGDCTTAILCANEGCTAEAVAAKTHVAGEDDGNCTTAILCANEGCTKEAVAAKAEHVANEDDGDCTTAVTCQNCSHVMVEAKAHVAGEDDGDCTTAILCANEGCTKEAVAAKAEHVANEDDGDCTTAVTCQNCSHVMVAAAEAHVAGEDDGDCTTAIKCANCEANAVEATKHTYTDCTDTSCNNEGCTATREGADHLYQHECSDKCHECGAENAGAVDHADVLINGTEEAGSDDKCDYCGAEMDTVGDTTPVPVQ